ncbi:MAG TPA: PASTA domain-containing protein [Vicinamibacterales bacterium]|nr:PASTA domain-containing protein [Vicinamibacterales bacterium]
MSADTGRPPLGRILTFYSYKGGTGRSMALSNVAWVLASAGRRVLVIDWDLEAPGLHRYFAPFLIDDEVTASKGLIDLVDDYSNAAIGPAQQGAATDPEWFRPYTDFSKYVVTVNFKKFPTGGSIDFLPAGRQGDHYALAVSSFNWQNFYDRLGGGGFFEAFKQRARDKYDYVLIDSRTGVSDTAGICSVQMPDTLVVCFTYNNQSIKGAAAVARSARATHRKIVDERQALLRSASAPRVSSNVQSQTLPFRVFPVPMRVDDGESDRLALREAFARETFKDLVDHIKPNEILEYWQQVQVPYRVFYAYEEVLSPFKDDPRSPRSVLASQVRLTKFITDDDVTEFKQLLSPEEQKTYLDAYAATTQGMPAPQRSEANQETTEQALARKADGALAALSEPERIVARRVLLRLVRVSPESEGTGYFPIRSRLTEFREDERAVAERLAGFGVLVIGSESRGAEPSVGLEPTLLTSWSTLIQWIRDDQDFLAWRQELRGFLTHWLRNERDDRSLLSGRSLFEADRWLGRRKADLNDVEIEFIERSKSWTPPAPAPAAVRSRLGFAWLALAVVSIAAVAWFGGGSLNLGKSSAADTPPLARVPKLEGLTSVEARDRATEARFTLLMSDGTAADRDFIENVIVVSQDPPADTMAPSSQPIRLKVAVATVSVPQLAGSDLSAASGVLRNQQLEVGETELRYVPNAAIDKVASQDPSPGALVAPGTKINVVVARLPLLNELRVGLYHLPQDAGLARDIRKYLEAKGQKVELLERDGKFFTGNRAPKENQIRYSAASEARAMGELGKLLSDGGFGTFRPVTTANTSDGFLSVFLWSQKAAAN